MHQYFSVNSDYSIDKSDEQVIHKCENIVAPGRFIFFISDPPHLVKTLRNCLYNSGSHSNSRLMWNNQLHLVWSHISNFFFEDQELGLHYLPKLTYDHINLTSY